MTQIVLQDYVRDGRDPRVAYALYGRDEENEKNWTEKKLRHKPKLSRPLSEARAESARLLKLDVF